MKAWPEMSQGEFSGLGQARGGAQPTILEGRELVIVGSDAFRGAVSEPSVPCPGCPALGQEVGVMELGAAQLPWPCAW